ncbi:hypothetical protein GQX73_g155 [Xylaria multiplex]|uniref:FAD/NAD(P)-binding domain-containing protein n=1 Tax=Xylaria multiplex TaxID=323545 RepID=A0A7C8N1Q2_9PEZI|nr:hypothetical protein GQX73_g155 [Xylaria multiplex]
METLDVAVIGAGISGINIAYRLTKELPHLKFQVLEARNSIGGTWDLYRYPGVRSDSDISTLGFEWHPWPFDRFLATGDEILEYLTTAVSKNRLDRYIRFGHRVLSADWSTADQSWTLSIAHHTPSLISSRWIILSTGYFDYETPLQQDIPGLDTFKGKVIHPQFWPRDLDYAKKKVAVIGSGATAVSLFPTLHDRAAQVTMIQRSPTYVVPCTNATWAQKYFPKPFLNMCRRAFYIVFLYLFVVLCEYFPNLVRNLLRRETSRLLPTHIDFETHFKPRYNPWEQRICFDLDGAFYKSLHASNTNIVTGVIESVSDNKIRMKDGNSIAADIIITATGIRMQLGGKVKLSVSGKPVSWRNRYIWNGAMLDSVPNMMFMFGYTNNAWTLGADNTAVIFTRLQRYMEKRGKKSAVPRLSPQAATGTQRLWQLSATYVLAAEDQLPVYGMAGNWKPRRCPPVDYICARWGDYTGDLDFSA